MARPYKREARSNRGAGYAAVRHAAKSGFSRHADCGYRFAVSYVAQTEREFIRQRQAEGIAAAKARGVRFGRQPMLRPENFPLMRQRWERGEISARQAAAQLKITHRTFLLWAKEKADI